MTLSTLILSMCHQICSYMCVYMGALAQGEPPARAAQCLRGEAQEA